MKARLMYRDADFEPAGELPPNGGEVEQDLELDTLFDGMARDDEFLHNIARDVLLTACSNDLDLDAKEFVIVTGANQGGKSTFLRSVGVAQLMMQCGMYVPARSFRANVCSNIFTHYKREEDANMESGKLDEELGRMSDIVDKLTPDSMILFNESFAATNEREGSEIATQVCTALVEKRVNLLFVTHLADFASRMYACGMESTGFLRAERRADGTRAFRVTEGRPLATSFGEDLYERVFGGD